LDSMTPRDFRTHILLIILALLLGSVRSATAAYRITAVLSTGLQPYVEAMQGFRDTISAAVPVLGPKSITYAEVKEYALDEQPTRASLRQEILADRPDLLVAIGTNALSFITVKSGDIPVVYLMVPYPAGIVNGRPNITGVNMQIAPTRQLDALLEAAPGLKRFGLIYDPLRLGPMVKEIEVAAREKNVALFAKPTRTSSAVQDLLDAMTGRIDCFWMLPDLTVVTPESVELILLFSLEHRVPVFSFSAKYLTRGAAFAVTFDNYDLGRSAAEMAMKILADQSVDAVPPIEPQTIRLQINRPVVKKLGIPMSSSQGNTP
jgi:putative ABC transport system substrate-binding protein